jgi:hypothetical protein
MHCVKTMNILRLHLFLFLIMGSVLHAEEVTFSNTIASIIYDKCSSCHHPGQSGPFSLMNYEDVRRHSETIVAVVEDKYMPPWKPIHTGIDFANSRQLSAMQVDAIRQWVRAGCPQGEPSQEPKPPEYTDGWSLGKPDLVVKMEQSFNVPADGPDIYRSFVLPVNLPDDRWVKAIELRPTARGAVHHALFFVDPTGTARQQLDADGRFGLRGMNFLRGSAGEFFKNGLMRIGGGLGGYVPGAVPNRLPGDLARRLPAGSDIIMQTHFHPTGKAESEQAELALYFADAAPAKQLVPIQLPPLFGLGAGIDIAAGNANFQIQQEYILPIDVQAIEVGGHAHYICSNMLMTAQLPSGETLELLRIDDWDLDWQDQYQFAESIDLPKGTKLTATIRYDNSSKNVANPFSPPRRISWGRESTDEMGSITLQVVARDESQRPLLEGSVRELTRGALRSRIKSQMGPFSAVFGSRLSSGRATQQDLLKRLDRNQDERLQAQEIPQQIRERLLDFFDRDNNNELEGDELKVMLESFSEMLK